MSLSDGQRKISVVPDKVGPTVDTATSREMQRPMTSKQAHAAYLKRNRGPRLSKEEQRREERRLQEQIRREIQEKDEKEKKEKDKQRASARAKLVRDKKKAKEEEEKLAKRQAGLPINPPRASQAMIASFFRGNGIGKKRNSDVDTRTACDDNSIPQQLDSIADAPGPTTATSPNSQQAKRQKLDPSQVPTTEIAGPYSLPKSSHKEPPSIQADKTDTPGSLLGHDLAESDSAAETSKTLSSSASQLDRESQEPYQRDHEPASVAPSPPSNELNNAQCPAIHEKAGTPQDQCLNDLLDVDGLEDLFPTATQLNRELQEEYDDSGYSEAGISVSEDHHAQPANDLHTMQAETSDSNSKGILPFFCTQDCVLSAQDIAEIETFSIVTCGKQSPKPHLSADKGNRSFNAEQMLRTRSDQTRTRSSQAGGHKGGTAFAKDSGASCQGAYRNHSHGRSQCKDTTLSPSAHRQNNKYFNKKPQDRHALAAHFTSSDLLAMENEDWSDLDD